MTHTQLGFCAEHAFSHWLCVTGELSFPAIASNVIIHYWIRIEERLLRELEHLKAPWTGLS
jgi:hypothetical protein